MLNGLYSYAFGTFSGERPLVNTRYTNGSINAGNIDNHIIKLGGSPFVKILGASGNSLLRIIMDDYK